MGISPSPSIRATTWTATRASWRWREGVDDAALNYFRQSEQLPSFLRLAVARHYTAGENGAPGSLAVARWWSDDPAPLPRWRQRGELPPEDEDAILGEGDDDWERTRLLASTVEDHELLDPTLPPDRLLYRLFHEEGVRAFRRRRLRRSAAARASACRLLKSFGAGELTDMREPDGPSSVTCEFCTKTYRFAPDEIT